MSFSQDDKPTNPAKQFIKVKGGELTYYDKESKQDVVVPSPIDFIVLDQLATVKGWSDADDSGYWSNEVRSVGSDELTIRTKNGVKETGIWKDIKGKPSVSGAKYNASIYIAHFVDGKAVLVNLGLSGAALNAWIEFTQNADIKKNKVRLARWDDASKGSVKYKVPVFESTPMTGGERDQAIELDQQLQAHLTAYLTQEPIEKVESFGEADVEDLVVTEIDDNFDLSSAIDEATKDLGI